MAYPERSGADAGNAENGVSSYGAARRLIEIKVNNRHINERRYMSSNFL